MDYLRMCSSWDIDICLQVLGKISLLSVAPPAYVFMYGGLIFPFLCLKSSDLDSDQLMSVVEVDNRLLQKCPMMREWLHEVFYWTSVSLDCLRFQL